MNISKIYQDVDLNSKVLGSQPHELIQMLIEKLQSDIKIAAVALRENNVPQKCKRLKSAMDITCYLGGCLEQNADPALYQRLNETYEYLSQQILYANAHNDIEALNICQKIIDDLCNWWKIMVNALENEHPF